MAETIGSLVDKITIINLKIYHMEEQINRDDVEEDFKLKIKDKISILKIQKNDLEDELTELFYNVISGKTRMKIYRQFKMYNDPQYKIKK